MKVLFTGGGTAGHVTPNVALIENLRADGHVTIYVGSAKGIEREIVSRLDIPYRAIATGKLRRYFDWQNFIDPLLIFWGFLQSLLICLRERPDVVFSKGGFVAVPVVYAAWLCRIPAIGHESDVTPGLANKLCFPVLTQICVNFPVTEQYLPRNKVTVTGTPVRTRLLDGDASKGREHLGIADDASILLIFGGSLGARRINAQVRAVLEELTSRFHVIHVTGEGQVDDNLNAIERYEQKEFLFDEFGDVLAAADVVVSRAGANSLYELLVLRKPHLLIPLSALASRGDQIDNARTFSAQGYSRMLEESELNDETFLQLVNEVFSDRVEIQTKLQQFEVVDSVTVITELIKSTGSGA
jgi:UDP-N-acetylglucosamine--N-acetylmuramyl-(pentapeptide) pyrophosphoryl-undecaprenol N-acetylglucosamine transferase